MQTSPQNTIADIATSTTEESHNESWETASNDVKRLIFRNLPVQARTSLCQSTKTNREFCRDKLPLNDKIETCLKYNTWAQNCDKIPMFSREQFFDFIPATIAIYPEDPIQLTHEFYSQNYKLSSEGFAEALFKARVLNKICAISRPDYFADDPSRFETLPPYVNRESIQICVREYLKVRDYDNDVYNDLSKTFKLEIILQGEGRNDCKIYITYDFTDENFPLVSRVLFYVNYIESSSQNRVYQSLMSDPFLIKLKPFMREWPDDNKSGVQAGDDFHDGHVNTFHLSRMLKVALDRNICEYVTIYSGDYTKSNSQLQIRI